MNKSKMLGCLRSARETMFSLSISDKYGDDIGYKSLYRDLVAMSDFLLANEAEFDEYEVLSFLEGIVIPAQMLKDINIPLSDRKRHLELISMLANGRMSVFKQLYSYDEKINALGNEHQDQHNKIIDITEIKKTLKETDTSPSAFEAKIKPPRPLKEENYNNNLKTVLFDSYSPQNILDRLTEAADDLARDFMLNRARLDNLGWGDEEKLYDRIVEWNVRAKDYLEQSISTGQPLEYYKKMAYNASNLASMMSYLLNSQNSEALKARADALGTKLNQMDEFYGQISKAL